MYTLPPKYYLNLKQVCYHRLPTHRTINSTKKVPMLDVLASHENSKHHELSVIMYR